MTKKLNLEEAAVHLGIGIDKVSTLKALVRGKKITYARVGRDLVFEEAWLDAYIEENKVKAEDNPWGLTDAAHARILEGRSTRKAS